MSYVKILITALLLTIAKVVGAQPFLYGIDVDNDVWEIDPVNKTTKKVVTSPQMYQTANALAWDPSHEDLFWVNAANTFQYWDRTTNTVKDVGGLSLGLTADPNNMAYYNGSIWYFEHNSNILREAQLTYAGADALTAVPSVSNINSYAVLGMSAFGINTNSFGDISIDTRTGTLYAFTSRGRLYSLDLANPITSFTQIVASLGNDRKVGLQLAHDANGTLYGTSYPQGDWYTIDVTTGALTPIGDFTTLLAGDRGIRDLAGAATTAYVAP